MFKLALSAGHGLPTAGKNCLKAIDPNETKEWVLNDRIADKIENKLKEYNGIEILRLDDTTGKTDVSLTNRSNAANKWGADFYLAIHHNAGIDGGSGGGIMAFTFTSVPQSTKTWQKELYNELIKLTGLKGNRSTPLATANLHECREPKADAVLLELGFMDSTTDTPIILTEDYAEKCAQACVNVIVSRAGLIKNTSSATTIYRVRKTWEDAKSQIGAYKSLDNAKAACKDGYSVFDENGNCVYTKTVKVENKNIDVTYQVYAGGKWYADVKNDTDYAGVFKKAISGVYANLSSGNITYKVHTLKGKWLPEVKNRADYAGILNKSIDAIAIKTDTGKTVKYRIHTLNGKWLPWVSGYDVNNSNTGYAGVIGTAIDAIQIKVE